MSVAIGICDRTSVVDVHNEQWGHLYNLHRLFLMFASAQGSHNSYA